MKRAVIFYSLSNNTQEAARYIAEKLDADLIRIETLKPMPTTMGKQMMYCGMLAVFGKCPKISGLPENVSEYDEIIIGTPIWAGVNAAPINTLAKSSDIAGKVTAVFTLSGGGDNDKAVPKLTTLFPNAKNIVALADRNHESAKDNISKMDDFVSKYLNRK